MFVDFVADDYDPFTGLDACAGPEAAVADLNHSIDSDALIESDDSVVGSFVSDGARDLKGIVDGLLRPPPSASLGRFTTSRLMRQVKPKLVVDSSDDYTKLHICDVVNDDFARVGRRRD